MILTIKRVLKAVVSLSLFRSHPQHTPRGPAKLPAAAVRDTGRKSHLRPQEFVSVSFVMRSLPLERRINR